MEDNTLLVQNITSQKTLKIRCSLVILLTVTISWVVAFQVHQVQDKACGRK